MLEGPNRWLEHVPGHLRLRTKACVIAGAGTDVAAMIARLFAAEGCRVLAIDEDERAIRELVDLIEAEGGPATACHTRTRRTEELERCLARRQFGQPDILIDNWSRPRIRRRGPFTASTAEQNSENVGLCPNCVDVFVAQSTDVIVDTPLLNPESIAVDTSLVSAFTRILAWNGGPNTIRVNTVCFNHNLRSISWKNTFASAAKLRAADLNVDGHLLILQIAYAALFLASDESRFVNGAVLSIDDAEINGKSFEV